MNLSSILVFTPTDNVSALHARLCKLPGVEVHYQCHDTGRLIVIQEACSDEAEMDGLQHIKNLPKVMAAEMFYHYVDDGNEHVTQTNNAGENLSWT